MDKLAAVAATTASDLEELSTGMSKVASAANIMGVDIDQLNSQLATVISVTRQAPESVGTAFKTIFARMGDIEAGLDSETTLGEYTSQMAELGVNVLDSNASLRDMGEVIEEIGNKWETLSREQQIALSQVMAGTRQYNNLLALFDNWDMYTQSLETSKQAAGTLAAQNEVYLDSLEAKMQKLTTTAESLYLTLFDSDSFKIAIDGITGIVKGIDFFIESLGGGGTLLLTISSLLSRIFSKQLSASIATTVSNIQGMRSNAEALTAALQNIQQVSKISGLDEATKKIIALKEQLITLRQAGYITNEEFQELSASIKEFKNSADNASRIKESATQIDRQLSADKVARDRVARAKRGQPTKAYVTLEDVAVEAEKLKQQYSSDLEVLANNKVFDAYISQLEAMKRAALAATEPIEKLLTETKFKANTTVEEKINIVSKNATEEPKWSLGTSDTALLSKETQKSITKGVDTFTQAREEYLRVLQKEKEAQEKLKQATDDNRADLEENVERAKEASKAQEAAYRESLSKVEELYDKAEKEINQNIKNIETTGEQVAKGMEKTSENTVRIIQSQFDRINLTKAITQVTNLVSGLGSLASSISMIANLGNIWNNDDLGFFEKVLQTIITLSSAFSMLTMSIASMRSSLTILKSLISTKGAEASATNTSTAAEAANAEARKATTGRIDAETEALNRNTAAKMANKNADNLSTPTSATGVGGTDLSTPTSATGVGGTTKLTGAMVAAAVVAAIVTALVSSAIIESIDSKFTKALEEAEGSAKKLSSALSEVSSEYDAITSSIENLNDKTSALDDLTVGTLEWKKAVADINSEVYALIDKYPELAHAVTTSEWGVLTIQDDALERLQEKQLAQLQLSQVAMAGGQADKAAAQAELAKNEAAEYVKYRGNKTAAQGGTVAGAGIAAGLVTVVGGAIGAKVGASLGSLAGPIGAAIGAAAGILIGSAVVGAIEKGREEQEEAWMESWDEYVTDENTSSEYQKLINAYRESGEQIFNSADTLAAALGANSTELTGVIGELASTTEGLKQLGEIIATASEQQITDYNERIEMGTTIVGAEASTAEKLLAGAEVVEKSEQKEFRDQFKDALTGGNKADEAAAKEVFDALGWDYASMGTKGANKVQRLDENGNTIQEYTMDEIAEQYYKIKAQDEVKSDWGNDPTIKSALESLETIAPERIMNQIAAATKGEADFTGLKIGEIEKATELDYEQLTRSQTDALEKLAKANNITYEQLIENLEAGTEDATLALRGLWTDVPVTIQKSIEQLNFDFEELDLSTADKFIGAYQKLVATNDTALLEGLDNILAASGALSDELITELMSTDWSTITDVEGAVDGILESLNLDLTPELEKSLDAIVRVMSSKVKSIKQLQEEYFEVQNLIDKATTGAAWSAEEYEKLTTEQRKYFAVMADGTALLIGDAKELKGLLQESAKTTAYNNALVAIEQREGAYEEWVSSGANLEERDKVQAATKQMQEALRQYALTASSKEEFQQIKTWAHGQGASVAGWGEVEEALDISFLSTVINKPLEETVALYRAFGSNVNAVKQYVAALESASGAIDKQKKIIADLEESYELLGDVQKRTATPSLIEAYRESIPKEREKFRQESLQITNEIKNLTGWDDVGLGRMLMDDSRWEYYKSNYLSSEHTKEEDEDFWKLNDLIKNYAKLSATTDEAIRESRQKILDLQLEQFELSLSVEVDRVEAQRAFEDFQKSFAEENDFDIRANLITDDFIQEYDLIQSHLNALKELEGKTVVDDLDFNENQNNIITVADKEAKTREIINDLLESGVNLLDIQTSLEEEYLSYQDAVNAAYERQIELIDTANQALDHQKAVIALMYGDKATKLLKDYYATQAKNAKDVLEQRKAQYVQDKADFDDMNANRANYSQEQQDALTSQYMSSTNAYLEAVSSALTARREQFLNEAAIALEEFDEQITGIGSDKAKEQWDWMQAEADDYLNALDEAFGIEQLINAYNKAASGTTDVRVQQKINELKEQELKPLREKDKLSKYDLDRAQKQLDILQARIALEDAQQNKTQMRLMRGANGTYSYQYVADQNAIDEAREKLSEAQKSLVELDEEQLKSNTEKVYSIYAEMMQKIANLTDESEISAVVEQYTDRLTSLGGAMSGLMDNIKDSVGAASVGLGIDDSLESIFPWLNSDWLQTVMSASERGWGAVFDDTLQKILSSLHNYTEGTKEITEGVEGIGDFNTIVSNFTTDVRNMTAAQENVINKLNNMNAQMQTLVNTTLPALNKVINDTKEALGEIATNEAYNFANTIPTEWEITAPGEDGKSQTWTLKALNTTDKDIAQAATGMYTGEWGSEGKLAVLHEKELVLNKQDTANILSAVDLVRSLNNSMLSTIASMSSGYDMPTAAWEMAKDLVIEQNVHIQAEFPNATDRAEIEAAFKELVGLAAQHAYTNTHN